MLIALGGAFGALLRYGVSGLTHRLAGASFPWGTLAVNLLGCLLIGFLWAFSEKVQLSPGVRLLVFTGVLGAFTTFSTFGLESFNLFREGEVGRGIVNILASNVLGLGCVFLGFIAARLLFESLQS